MLTNLTTEEPSQLPAGLFCASPLFQSGYQVVLNSCSCRPHGQGDPPCIRLASCLRPTWGGKPLPSPFYFILNRHTLKWPFARFDSSKAAL